LTNIFADGCPVSFPNTSFVVTGESGTAPSALVRPVVRVRPQRAEPYQKTWFLISGPPRLAEPVYRSTVLGIWTISPAEFSVLAPALNLRGRRSMFRMPWSSLVPERLTALVTNPVARPNSAVIAPRFTLNSAMSSPFTSVER